MTDRKVKKIMMSQLKKSKNKIILATIFLLSIVLCYFASVSTTLAYKSYNGLDPASIGKLNDSEEKNNYQSELDNNPSIKTTRLTNGDMLNQDIWVDAVYLDNIMFNIQVNDDTILDISILDERGNVIYNGKSNVQSGFSTIDLDINSKRYDRKTKFTLKIEVVSSKETLIDVYNCTYPDGSLKINDKSQNNVILTKIVGSIDIYKEKTIICIIIVLVLLILTGLFSLYREYGRFYKFINKKLTSFGNIFYLVSEWLAFLALLYVFLNFFCSWVYAQQINLFYLVLFVYFLGIFIFAFLMLLQKYKNNIPMLFLIIAVPVGLTYIFAMLPEQVPDENAHFAKAYLTSTFNFTSTTDFKITTNFNSFGIKNYNDILPAVFNFDNYQSLKISHEACAYNFILYIIPGIVIFVTRVLCLSVYASFYLGRMANLIIFLHFSYNTIKLVPVGKWIFFIYLFNPMLLQQAASFSADSLINNVCIFSVAYFLKLKFSDEAISNKDIIIVMSMLGFILVTKYVYLPLFGVYLLVFNKLIKINRQQIILMITCIAVIICYYILSKELGKNATALVAQSEYVKNMGIDQGKQIKFLLSNPTNIFNMIIETFKAKGSFYLQTFAGKLGWLAIDINKVSYLGYYLLLGTSIFYSSKYDLKFKERIWIVTVSLIVICLVILGLYLQWTTVGTFVTEGVQGRYFIPCMITLLVGIGGIKKLKISRYEIILPITICFLEMLVLIDIIKYFI